MKLCYLKILIFRTIYFHYHGKVYSFQEGCRTIEEKKKPPPKLLIPKGRWSNGWRSMYDCCIMDDETYVHMAIVTALKRNFEKNDQVLQVIPSMAGNLLLRWSIKSIPWSIKWDIYIKVYLKKRFICSINLKTQTKHRNILLKPLKSTIEKLN